MNEGGVSFGSVKAILAQVTDNGVAEDDPRVIIRTNEATKIILDSITPVGGMMTVDVNAKGTVITLPPQLKNAIDVEVMDGAAVRGNKDITQSFYDIINQSTYLDPSLAHDNPMIDLGLSTEKPSRFTDGIITLVDFQKFQSATANFTNADQGSVITGDFITPGTFIGTITSPTEVILNQPQVGGAPNVRFVIEKRATPLMRSYDYPGLQANARVRVTGERAYIPIISDGDFLIVQNVEALKLMILSIERYENNAADAGKAYRDSALELLATEVKRFIEDPRNVMRRKARYEDDIAKYARGTFGWTRARIALEAPGAMLLGKSEIGRILGDSEYRLMERVPMARGCVKEYRGTVTSGYIYFPADVDSVIGAAICGCPIDIRSITFKYLENGPGDSGCGCVPFLEDDGEEFFPTSKNTRRRFRLIGISDMEAATITFAAKLRYIDKQPGDQLVIKHYPSLLLMCQCIISERGEKWQEAVAAQQSAVSTLQSDLDTFLKGIKQTLPVQTYGFGMGDVGGML